MKKLRQLLVMLLLMVSGNISALYQWYDYSEPFILSSDPLSSYQAIGGVHLDPSITTLVIPNKIDGRIVGNVVPRYYTYLSKFRYESWGNYYSKNVKFSPFERSCNMRVDDDYGNEYRRFDLLPRVSNDVYDYGVEPVFDKTKLLGEPLYIEEIVFPSMMENFFSEPIVKGLTSLKRLYMRRTGWIVNFGIDLTGCTNMEEIHLMCDVPHYVVDDSKIPHKINLYVPQKYYNNYMADPDWANSPSFNILPEPTNGATLKIKNTYPGLLVTIDGINIYGNDSPGYVSTMNFGKYYMPRYKVSYGGVGAIKVTLNGQSLDDFENEDALLDLVPGENILELELVNSSEVTLNSNGNGSIVKWNGKQVIGNAGGTYKLEDVKSDASNTLVVNYAPGTQELTVKKGSTILTPTSNSGGTATFEIGKVMTDCNIDVQVKDKLCNITVSKTTVDGDLKVVRSVDGKAYFTYLIDDMTFQAGRGTTISIDVPNTMILTTAQLGGVNMTKITHSNGVSTYSATVPSSTAATLRLVGQRVTASTSYLDYSLQTITKIGNGTVSYLKWHTDNQNNVREESGVLTTPVSTFLAPFGYDENGNGWTLTIKPDTGYELTTLYGTWGHENIQNVSVPKSYNMLSEPAYIDNATGTTYNNHDGPTVGQKRAAGGNFSLDLEVGRTISYDASTHTYTFTVKGADWDGVDMAITIGFSNPNESSKKQMSVVAVGTPTDGELILEYSLASNNTQHSEVLLTSTGSTTKEYQLGDFKYIYFFMNYEGGHDLEGSSSVPMPFTVYHNGVDVTSQFEYDDREIYGPLTDVTMEGNWTFVFPDGNQATDAKWSFLKSGEGSLSCEIVPTGTSVEPTTRIIGNSSEILRLQKDEVQSVIVKVQTADGNTFKAFCNGSDVTSNFTLSGSEYTLTTNQADLKDANWTVLFTEGQAANTFTYQFSQTTGGEVLVGVVPVGDTSADIKSIQEGSMTLSLTSDEAQGVILFVEPEDNMAVRIYSGETDVTSQFTYDSSSNSYMRQTTSLANETLLFVFADKNELGVATDIIEFADEAVKAICVANWDTNGDGELSKAEAAAVEKLRVLNSDKTVYASPFKSNTVITSFNEFQYFTGLTEVCDSAFYYCQNLESIIVPKNVKTIGVKAFNYCRKLTFVQLPEGLTTIKSTAFWCCTALPVLHLPETVTTLESQALSQMNALQTIKLPDNLTNGSNALHASNGLKSIFIPAKVTSTSNIISGCGSLISISVSPQNTVWDSRNGCNALIRTSDNTLVQGSVNTIIPDGVVTIGTDAFSTASDGIAIESVKMPNSVKKIGIRAFIRCKKLKSVELSSSVETIEMNAFQNCTALTSVVSKIETPFKFGTNAFYNINPACVLTVPKGKRQAYIDAGWTEDIFKGGIVEVEDEIPGDMNGDGSVTIADVTKLVNKVLGKDEPSSNP